MSEKSRWFLHSRMGNTFHFKHVDHPEEITCSFSITYVDDGFSVLTGDMGYLTWCRYRGLDYGFPGKGSNIGYFAEKVCSETKTWDKEKAIEDIKEYINELRTEEEEDNLVLATKLEEMLESENWEENNSIPDVGRYQMLSDLQNVDSYNEWYEHSFGDVWEPNFKRKYEMLKSVSEIILDVVKKGV